MLTRKGFFFILVFSIFISSILIDLNFELLYKKSDISKNYRTVREATVAIVPGAAVYGKTPSPVLRDRLESALLLYKNKKVKKILLSGDNGSHYYNELKPMLKFMLNNKVRKEDIFVDHAGFRTLDTLIRAKIIFEIEDAIFVSQKFHLPRAMFISKQLGIRIAGYEADRRIYTSEKYNRIREFLARNLAWIDMNLMHTNPRFLGKPYPISGSGEKTWKGSIL
ncbi:MAG: YdcF family protein [Leptospiraceae bacterium]|nr:YdcF family protein [Leptospiraceae bacterium]NUM40205.1 YdcF family protein [Leptospiraceae bacterium]